MLVRCSVCIYLLAEVLLLDGWRPRSGKLERPSAAWLGGNAKWSYTAHHLSKLRILDDVR